MHASVIFLVDAKLVLLQPTTDAIGNAKYDMRIIASDVEYFIFTRDQLSFRHSIGAASLPPSPDRSNDLSQSSLQDSLWYFDGHQMQCWTDIQDLLKSLSVEGNKEPLLPVPVTTDFFPTSIELSKGVIIGLEPDLVQRRDIPFALFRLAIRVG